MNEAAVTANLAASDREASLKGQRLKSHVATQMVYRYETEGNAKELMVATCGQVHADKSFVCEWEDSYGQLLSKNTPTQNVTNSKRALA
ncbi:MAG: hypothetical protein ACRC1Z_11250 [Waterburya sp.]